jgi:FMN phosphatase YigB (HAD superfamily)
VARSARLIPGAEKALDGAGGLGLKIGGAGNTPWGSAYLRADLESLGIAEPFETIVGSADVGYRKPNLFLLKKTLENLDVKGSEAVHVGDDPKEDVEALATHCKAKAHTLWPCSIALLPGRHLCGTAVRLPVRRPSWFSSTGWARGAGTGKPIPSRA